MGDARTEVVAALIPIFAGLFPCNCHEAYTGRGLVDPTCIYHQTVDDLADLVDAIPTAALVRLLIDRGGLEQVGWVQQNTSPGAEHPWRLGRHWPDGVIPPSRWVGWAPVYRLSEEPTGA